METKNSGTILVVEDEAGVRDVAVQMLKFTGFKVIEAVDAQSGLEQFNQNPDIDLVFTDVIMPGGTSGIEMVKSMLAKKPHTLILLATGYSAKAEALVNTASKSENIGVVAKPYDINKIPTLISGMIENAAGRS
ncbi:MAG: response regulator [Pseudohongiellaceae bacterium]